MFNCNWCSRNEMPDIWVEKSMAAYQNFCHRFWPGHIDDPEATFREYTPDSEKKKINFLGTFR